MKRAMLDIDKHIFRPYPYFTKSLKRTAQHYDLMAKLFDMMELEPGASILECGFGWGNTTLALAMLDYKVTALDIEQLYCELVERRAKILDVQNVEFVNSDFLWVETTDRKFDAVVYFESFHHCWDFERLLKALHRVLNPGGKIYFGAEPINDGFKVPWGVRLDGESLFVARRSGWMELGFRPEFFAELLLRTGWRGVNVGPHFWMATRRSEPLWLPADRSGFGSQFGVRENGGMTIAPVGDQQHYALFGPYINMTPGTYDFSFRLKSSGESAMPIVLDICSNRGNEVHMSREFDGDAIRSGNLSLRVTLDEAISDLECLILVHGSFSGEVEGISISEQT